MHTANEALTGVTNLVQQDIKYITVTSNNDTMKSISIKQLARRQA